MFVRMKTLQHWKSEHDALSCEDAVRTDMGQGLFALADGAGTTLFAHIWAKVLVEHFLQIPLMSNDPFEVEWWIRQAQKRYQQEVPPLALSSWNARQKVRNQGSSSTLATLRVQQNDAQSMQVAFLAIGDTCLLICKAGEKQLQTFPYTRPADFDSAPVCLPSLPTLFDRSFHHCLLQAYTLQPGDQAILATDAVARWIISAGKGAYADTREAFQVIAEQHPQSWPTFIENCRLHKDMVDDDSTALYLSFTAEASQDTQEPGITSVHTPELRVLRKQEFEQAQQEQNKELQAIVYGDGTDLALEGSALSLAEREQARQVADALHAVLAELRRTLNSPDMLPRMRRIWTQYASLLDTEPCATHVRQTLTQSGVLPLPHALSQPEITTGPVQATFATLPPTPSEHQPSLLPSIDQAEKQQAIRLGLASKNIEQMALAYTQLSDVPIFLSFAEQERLKLAYQFKTAFDAQADDQLLEIYTQILRSDDRINFELNGPEDERIAIIGHRKDVQKAQAAECILPQVARAETLNTAWIEKVAQVKYFYLIYKDCPVPLNQVGQLALADLNNEELIQLGIQEINTHNKRKILDPESELEKDFKRFRRLYKKDCEILINKYNFSENEIKSIVTIFVRAQILENYLQRTIHLSLQDWLEQRKRPQLIQQNHIEEG